MAYEVRIYAQKRGEETLVAHAAYLNDEEWRNRDNNLVPAKTPGAQKIGPDYAKELGPIVKRFDGKDPADLHVAVAEMAKSTPDEKAYLRGLLNDLWLACEHVRRLRASQKPSNDGQNLIPELYDDFVVRVQKV